MPAKRCGEAAAQAVTARSNEFDPKRDEREAQSAGWLFSEIAKALSPFWARMSDRALFVGPLGWKAYGAIGARGSG
jgi:hypothetical protein